MGNEHDHDRAAQLTALDRQRVRTDYTLAQWLELWLATIAPRRIRARTAESYTSPMRRHVMPVLGDVPLRDLTPEHIELLLSELVTRGLSAATQTRIYSILSRALKVAAQRGHVERNVAVLVDAPIV